MDLIFTLSTFVRVAETGSFSAVARERGTTQSAISRQVTALEGELGVRLLQRTTRRLALTEDGEDTLEHARHVLEAVEATREAAARRRGEAAGTVRLATTVLLGNLIARRVPVLIARHPGLALQLVTGERAHDMVEEGLDLWLRVGESTHATHVSRVVAHAAPLLVVAPAYLAARGTPGHPRDLAAHDCLVQQRLGADHVWRFAGPEGDVAVPIAGRFGADNADAVMRAALAGVGVALVAEVVAHAEVAAGHLVPLLPAYVPEAVALTLVYPSRRNLAPRVRAVIEFITRDVLGRPDPFGAMHEQDG